MCEDQVLGRLPPSRLRTAETQGSVISSPIQTEFQKMNSQKLNKEIPGIVNTITLNNSIYLATITKNINCISYIKSSPILVQLT